MQAQNSQTCQETSYCTGLTKQYTDVQAAPVQPGSLGLMSGM